MAKDCDCTMIPFDDKCLTYCIELILRKNIDLILRKASVNEKQTILGFDLDLAQTIYDAYHTGSINNFEDLKNVLTPYQVSTVISTFGSLTQDKLDYFNNR
jgi:hypothetical protein